MSKAFQPLHEPTCELFFSSSIEIVRAEFTIRNRAGDQVIGNSQDCVCHGHERSLAAVADGQPLKLSGKIVVLGMGGGPCCLAQCAA
jgi:hypothetical protein